MTIGIVMLGAHQGVVNQDGETNGYAPALGRAECILSRVTSWCSSPSPASAPPPAATAGLTAVLPAHGRRAAAMPRRPALPRAPPPPVRSHPDQWRSQHRAKPRAKPVKTVPNNGKLLVMNSAQKYLGFTPRAMARVA